MFEPRQTSCNWPTLLKILTNYAAGITFLIKKVGRESCLSLCYIILLFYHLATQQTNSYHCMRNLCSFTLNTNTAFRFKIRLISPWCLTLLFMKHHTFLTASSELQTGWLNTLFRPDDVLLKQLGTFQEKTNGSIKVTEQAPVVCQTWKRNLCWWYIGNRTYT